LALRRNGMCKVDICDGVQATDSEGSDSPTAIVEMSNEAEVIDIHHAMSVSNATGFPVDDFFRITHHVRMIEGTETFDIILVN